MRRCPARRNRAAGGPVYRAVFCFVLILGVCGCEARPADTGHVVRVLDGDSAIVLMTGGRELEVRLFGIDAPERRQPWSRKSRQALVRLTADREVRLEPVTLDSYGRTVAIMYRVSDGMNINREMVRQGHAWVYRRYDRDPEAIALEDAARENRVGLWGLPPPERIPPWTWRRQNRRDSRDENGA